MAAVDGRPGGARRRSTPSGTVTPPGARLLDRIRLATDVAAVTDPLRFELAAASVMACGRSLVAVLVEALELGGGRRRPPPLVLPGRRTGTGAVASRLWPRLSDRAPTEAAVRALNGALVLCADHELATSTFAVRVAASTRANPYAAVGAGLGALDGPLHGTVSELVHGLLADAERDGVDAGRRAPAAPRRPAARIRPPALSRRRPPGPGPARPGARRTGSTAPVSTWPPPCSTPWSTGPASSPTSTSPSGRWPSPGG